MKFATLGTDISAVEVTNISQHGFWLLLENEELFLPFAEFPWFREASVGNRVAMQCRLTGRSTGAPTGGRPVNSTLGGKRNDQSAM